MSKVENERDPYGIVPDGFYDRFDSIEEAKRCLERHNPPENEPRCPECHTTDIRKKRGQYASDASHKKPETYYCKGCNSHFFKPIMGISTSKYSSNGVPIYDIPIVPVLKLMRKLSGLSQRKVAESVGVSNTTIMYWERGESKMRVKDARKLLRFYMEEI